MTEIMRVSQLPMINKKGKEMNKMDTLKLSNIPSLTVNQIISNLANMYSTTLQKQIPLRNLPSVMLWGPPGVGKSQAIRQLAGEIEMLTGKCTKVTDVRLLLFNPIDLRGIPTANADKTLAIWLKPQIFQMDDSDAVVNILFLDEISAAPQSVQAAAYQITLDRVVGEHRLPENCIVIAAGNRITDKSVAFKMPKALANRLLHIEVESSFEAWRAWAVEKGIHEKVIGFLAFRQDALMGFEASVDDLAFATPRTWEMVSNILQIVNEDVDEMYAMIAGLVGTGMAVEFSSWTRVYENLPNIEDIFNGKFPPIPISTDVLYALTTSMTAYARDHKDDMVKIDNSMRYAEKMPADFSTMLMKDYMYLEKGYQEKLMQMPSFSRWISSKGRLLNGLN